MTMNEYGKDRIQVRCEFDKNRIHVQGIGSTQVNRKYGLALEMQAPPKLTSWLMEQEPTVVSPASGNLLYVEAELRHHFEDDDKTQMLIHGEELNHPEGAILDIDGPTIKQLMEGEAPLEDLNPITQLLLEWAKKSGLLTLTAGKAYDTEDINQ